MNKLVDPTGAITTARSVRKRPAVIDADVHPTLRTGADLKPYMTPEHWAMFDAFGAGGNTPFRYPKAVPDAHRADARPPDGAIAGSDYDFLKSQYLDALNVEYAMLNPLRFSGQEAMHPILAPALCRATNEWQCDRWTRRDKRLKASIVVPFEQPEIAAAEIEARAGNPDFAQVLLLTRTADPLGRRRYWPIYEKAAAHGLPIAIHVFGAPGHPPTPAGWPIYYIEEMTSHSAACAGMIASLVIEGVFERFPSLTIVNLEGGFGWVPSLAWRMDRLFERFRGEVPHLQRKPSEYLREHVYFATQPIEEPEHRRHLIDTINWIGADRLLFSSDYPHWDFDDPIRALPSRAQLSEADLEKIRIGNARHVYRL